MKTFYKLKKGKKEVAFISEFKIEPRINIECEDGWKYGELEQSEIDGAFYELGFAPMKSDEDKVKEQAQARIQEIDQQLDDLDLQSIRPERSIRSAEHRGEQPNPEDLAKLDELEQQAVALRNERKEQTYIIDPSLRPQPEPEPVVPEVQPEKPEQKPTKTVNTNNQEEQTK